MVCHNVSHHKYSLILEPGYFVEKWETSYCHKHNRRFAHSLSQGFGKDRTFSELLISHTGVEIHQNVTGSRFIGKVNRRIQNRAAVQSRIGSTSEGQAKVDICTYYYTVGRGILTLPERDG